MDVPSVGPAPTGAEFSDALRALAGPRAPRLATLASITQSVDTATLLLGELSEVEVFRLLQIIDRPIPPELAARLDGLLRGSVSAVADGKMELALVNLAEFALLDPQRAETLDTQPGLASIRPDIGRLLFRLATAAQLGAEARLEQATQMSQTAGANGLKGEFAGQEVRPEVAILMASRLLEAGGLINCLHSSELTQLLINQYGWAPAPVPAPRLGSSGAPICPARASLDLLKRWTTSIRRLWLRAPLLVLLLAWFAVGVGIGSISALVRNYWPQIYPESLVALGFEIWGVGFLALISFAFYASVRYPRR